MNPQVAGGNAIAIKQHVIGLAEGRRGAPTEMGPLRLRIEQREKGSWEVVTAKALADLRQVSWNRGPIGFGKNRNGKGSAQGSEVAAISWAMRQALYRQGFLDEYGNERSVEVLADYHARLKACRDSLPVDNPYTFETEQLQASQRLSDGKPVVGQCPDRDCCGDLVMIDGCPTCMDCSYSSAPEMWSPVHMLLQGVLQ